MDMVNVITMPGLIPGPNSGSFIENKKNIGSQMGQTDKKTFKKKKFSQNKLTKFWAQEN
jgi:hypothetical protein